MFERSRYGSPTTSGRRVSHGLEEVVRCIFQTFFTGLLFSDVESRTDNTGSRGSVVLANQLTCPRLVGNFV